MIYEYVAYNSNGEVVKGKLSAVNDQGASELLDYAGYRAITLKQYRPFFSAESIGLELYKVQPS